MTNIDITEGYINKHPNCGLREIAMFLGHIDDSHVRQYVSILVMQGKIKKHMGFRGRVTLTPAKRNIKNKQK